SSIPSSNTFTLCCRASSTIAARLSRSAGSGKPRKPSLAPSSITSTAGWYSRSRAGNRLRPLREVSPLMLALTAVHFGTMLERRTSSRCTQPDSTGMLCAADRESPRTRTVFGVAAWAPPMPQRKTSNHRHRRMNDPTRPLLEACHVSKSVRGPEGRLEILSGVDLRIMAGESFAIVGASASGVSRPASRPSRDTPDAGDITLDGHALHRLDEEARADLRRRLVGFVFQSFHLLPALTAEEN